MVEKEGIWQLLNFNAPKLSFLDLMTLTLTFELYLDILPIQLHVRNQVHASVRLARIVRHMDTQTHTYWTHYAKIITPSAVIRFSM